MLTTKSKTQAMCLQKDSKSEQIKNYFNKVFDLRKTGKQYPVNLDEVWPLVYTRKEEAVRVLKSDFIENEDFVLLRHNAEQKKRGGHNKIDYQMSVECLEYFIAKKVKGVFEVYRQVFHRSVEHVANALPPAKPILVQPVPDIFTKLKEEFNEKVRTIVINGTTYFKLIDIETMAYTGGHATNQITRQTVKQYMKEGDAITILHQNNYHNYWVNYFALKGMLERVNTRKGILLYLALFEQGEPLPAPVLPPSQVRVVINKLLKGSEHGCKI